MKKTKISVLVFLGLGFLFSCKEDPTPYQSYNGWYYTGGDATVKDNEDATIDFDIDNNLNVDGDVRITSDLSIKNDLNLNTKGKGIIDTEFENDTVRITGNMNLNDSLLIQRGIVILYGNLNINSNGVLNVSDGAQLQVRYDINHNGRFYGTRNLTVNGTFYKNGGSFSQSEPLTIKQ